MANRLCKNGRSNSVNEDKRADLLKDEYIMLQKQYSDMDAKGLTIKNWAITVALAIIGASFVYANKNLLWLGIAAALVFWYLEGYWRGLTHFFVVRIQRIETVMQGDAWKSETPLQVYSAWDEEYRKVRDQTLRAMFKRASLLPHAVIPVFILVLYFLL
jgi:hypothetical protein